MMNYRAYIQRGSSLAFFKEVKEMDELFNLITAYGLETILLALTINIITGFVKLPIKLIASKTKNKNKITRFIVFLPIVLGFLITYLYSMYFLDTKLLNEEFLTLWITSTSFSLTFYAIFEKFIPTSSDTDIELKINEKLVMLLQELLTLTKQDKREKENRKIVLGRSISKEE